MRPRARSFVPVLIFALSTLVAVLPLTAVVQPQDSPVLEKTFHHQDLLIKDRYVSVAEARASGDAPVTADLEALGVTAEAAFLDLRSGRWATLMPAKPLLPGDGDGNQLTWESLGLEAPAGMEAQEELTWNIFVDYLRTNANELLIDVNELRDPGNVVIHDDGQRIQIYAPRVVHGIAVRDSGLTAVVNHGNLTLFGSRNWADITTSPLPTLTAEVAIVVTQTHLGSIHANAWATSELAYVPMTVGSDGIGFRLAWVLRPEIQGDLGTWEALVDAHSAELIAFQDLNHYERVIDGGVFPQSNDGVGPEGTEQPNYAMPFVDYTNGVDSGFTDSGGNVPDGVGGTITTTLDGQFVRMNDLCGAIDESTAGDVLDLGTSGGTDCATPPGASAGNTHSSRTGAYELNRIIEMAKGHLPGNTWLQGQLTANMNINLSCNAFWNGFSVNFYRSGDCAPGIPASNTGELAGVFDHEWGHGMDDNDANGFINRPSEAIADIYATLRLNTSCGGRGFFLAQNCGGYGDPCLSCDGIREMDWEKYASGAPHTIANYVLDTPGTPNGGCQGFGVQFGPCGGETHCAGIVPGEAIYDLIHRDLPGDYNTANEIVTRLTYLANGLISNWYTCDGDGTDGCNADGGYLNYLAMDDDNGNLADGTPHMTAIFDAFNRHGLACETPTVQDAGCGGGPTTAPVVTATALDRGAQLSWDPVAGASNYKIYRTEGVFGCDLGKIIAGETTGTTFEDSGLKNDTEAYYVVAAIGPDDACIGPASACTTVIPSGTSIFADGFESGDTTAWSSTVP